MNVNLIGKKLYKNQLLHRSLEYAADKTPKFITGAALAFSTLRPVTILATPKTDRENKKLACAKSIASAGINYTIMYGLANILTKGIKNIEENPAKYLKKTTINTLKESGKPLSASGKYQFLAQLFKLGLGLVMAIPKSTLTSALIPTITQKILEHKKKTSKQNVPPQKIKPVTGKSMTFKGGAKLNPLSKKIAKVMDNPRMQKMAEKYKDTNYQMHIPALSDTVATATFIYSNKSKKIPNDRRRILNINAGIATVLSIGTSYIVDKALDKPTQKFIKKFSEVNKDAPKLAKYVEGIKIAKPILIMGSIYYLAIPLVSTFWAERIDKKHK